MAEPVLPEPLVPPEVDLRDFPFMPVDIGRLFGSEFHAQSDDGAWRAGVTLFLKSYHQVPAASIPDDEIALARLAELGRDLRTWRKIKGSALRGWIKCSDGRLYHRVVAEKALEGWIEKLGQRKSSAAGNAKRHNHAFDPTPIDSAIEDAIKRLAALNPSSRLLSKRFAKPSRSAPDGSPETLPSGAKKPPDGSPGPLPTGSPRASKRLPSGSQETGTGTETEKKQELSSSIAVPPEIDDDDLRNRVSKIAPGKIAQTCRDVSPIRTLIAEGFDLDSEILPTIAERAALLKEPLKTFKAEFIRKQMDLLRRAPRSASATGDPIVGRVFVATDLADWPRVADLHYRKHGRRPPEHPGPGGVPGWHFSAAWLTPAVAIEPRGAAE